MFKVEKGIHCPLESGEQIVLELCYVHTLEGIIIYLNGQQTVSIFFSYLHYQKISYCYKNCGNKNNLL